MLGRSILRHLLYRSMLERINAGAARGNSVVLTIRGGKTFERLFSGKPAAVKYVTTTPEQDAVAKEVEVSYSDKQGGGFAVPRCGHVPAPPHSPTLVGPAACRPPVVSARTRCSRSGACRRCRRV